MLSQKTCVFAWWWHFRLCGTWMEWYMGEPGPSRLLCWVLVSTEPGGNALGWTSYLPSDGVWAADHSRLQDSWVLSKCTLHLNRPDPVAGREKQTLSRVLLSPMKLQRKKESVDNLTLRNWSRHHLFPWTKSSHPCPCGPGPRWCKSPLVLMLLSSQGCPERHSEPIKGHLNSHSVHMAWAVPCRCLRTPQQEIQWPEVPTGQGAVNLWVFPFLTERKLPEND